MQHDQLQCLLEKYIHGIINNDELALLETWYLQRDIKPVILSCAELEKIKEEVWISLNLCDGSLPRKRD